MGSESDGGCGGRFRRVEISKSRGNGLVEIRKVINAKKWWWNPPRAQEKKIRIVIVLRGNETWCALLAGSRMEGRARASEKTREKKSSPMNSLDFFIWAVECVQPSFGAIMPCGTFSVVDDLGVSDHGAVTTKASGFVRAHGHSPWEGDRRMSVSALLLWFLWKRKHDPCR